MKKESISKTLGITQEELAGLLQVSRSQLSLYEIGKRNLPIHAKTKLSGMLQAIKNKTGKITDLSPESILSESDPENLITELIQANQYKQLIAEKKLKAAIIKNNKKIAKSHLIDFLKNENFNSKLIKSLEDHSTQTLKTDLAKTILKLQIQKEVLQQEEKILKGYLKKKI